MYITAQKVINYMIFTQLLISATFNPDQKRQNCRKGFDEAYFDDLFAIENEIMGLTFDNYCFTEDLKTTFCCLPKHLKHSKIESWVIKTR